MGQSFKFNNLEREYQYFKSKIDKAVQKVMASGHYLFGPELEKLEENFRKLTGKKYAIGVKNATDAITLAIEGIKAYKYSNISCYLPRFGAYPTAIAAKNARAMLTFVDIDETLTINPSDFDKKDISDSQSKHIVIAVDLFGNDTNRIEKIDNRYIIQDCAQSTCKKDYSWADINIFSFYPTKPLASMGDGGMICLDDEELYNKIKSMRFYGIEDNKVERFGINSRMDEIQAAIVNVKFPYLDEMNARRQLVAEKYMNAIPHSLVHVMHANPGCVYHQFPIIVFDRSKVRAKLIDAGIPHMIHYPHYVSDMQYFGGSEKKDLKRVSDHIISLPCHSWMKESEINKVADFLSKLR